MHSTFDEPERKKFVQAELYRGVFEFPEEIETAYSDVYSWLIQQADGMEKFIRNRNFNLDYYKPNPDSEISNWKCAGWEFSRLVPGHTLKAYKLFLNIQSELENKSNNCAILDTPILSIIDNGCGCGSVTIALISLLINYHKYRFANRLPIYPVKIYCLGIDPNHVVLQIYTKFLEECSFSLKNYLIDCEVKTIIGTFPEHIGELIIWLKEKDRLQSVILGLGNVIRPITEEYNRISNLLRFLRVKLNFPINIDKDSYSREITAIKILMDNTSIDTLVTAMIGSDSTNPDSSTKKWDMEVYLFQNNLREALSNHEAVSEEHVREQLECKGPRDCFSRKILGNHNPFSVNFELAFSIFSNANFILDKDWQKILSEDNLLLAWARARNELSFFQTEDVIEVRLFERNIHDRIRRLRRDTLSYRWKSLNISEMLNFCAPKGEDKNPRPLNLCRIEEQIIGIAILQILCPNFFEHHNRSYAYKLSKKSSEFLYEDWYEAHSRFIEDVRKSVIKNPGHIVIRTDIESYYTKIRQDKLLEELVQNSRTHDSRISQALRLLIERKFDWEENLAIPQGHAMSGLISDVYLSGIDSKFGNKYLYDVEYFRYVDDIVIICKPEQEVSIFEELDNSLRELGLTRSKDKTQLLKGEDYLLQTEKDIILDKIGKEHINLLREMYKLDDKHYSLSQQNWWEFLKKYQLILAKLGVFISIPRLSRKVRMNDNWRSRLFSFWKSTKFPYVSEMADLDDIDKWLETFKDFNQFWIERRQALQEYLKRMLHEGLDSLQNSSNENELAMAQIKIKFSSYRLGQLGFGDCAELVAQIVIKQPWLINVRRIMQALGLQNYEDLLIKIYFDTPKSKPEWHFIKSNAIKAMAELPQQSERVIELLSSIIISADSSALEKTMASEVLLLIKNPYIPKLENLENHLTDINNPYLAKNLILLTNKYKPEIITSEINFGNADIVNETIQFTKMNYQVNELLKYEPDILSGYYFGVYPDNSKEFRDPAT